MADETRPTGGVTAHIVIRRGRGKEAVAFYEKAFAAKLVGHQMADDGKRFLHGNLAINGGYVMFHDDFPEYRDGSTAAAPEGVVLHLQVDDADAWWKRALDAGAEVKFPIDDQFWGDRYGQLTDPFGHSWSIGAPLAG